MELEAAGAYTFGSLQITGGSSASTTLANNVNGPASITVTGALVFTAGFAFDAIVNDSGVGTNWILQGDVTNNTTVGTLSWTAGSGTITLSGTSNQQIDFLGETLEGFIINKSGGTVTLDGDLTVDYFMGMDGTFDCANTAFVITTTADCDWLAGFVLSNLSGTVWDIGQDFTADGQDLVVSATWYLNVTGSAFAAGMGSVQNSDASGGTTIPAELWTELIPDSAINWLFGAELPSSSSSSSPSSPAIDSGNSRRRGNSAAARGWS